MKTREEKLQELADYYDIDIDIVKSIKIYNVNYYLNAYGGHGEIGHDPELIKEDLEIDPSTVEIDWSQICDVDIDEDSDELPINYIEDYIKDHLV